MAGTRQSPVDLRRSDYGSFEYTLRDERLQMIVAQQRYISLDHLADFADAHLRPAIDEPEDESGVKKKRGGKRDTVGWPLDRKKRLHAMTELVRKWERKQGYVETWKPWEHQCAWVRMNGAGLLNLGLPWSEIPFPEERKRLLISGHAYQVNKRRLALARGNADAPKHEWIGERAILHDQLKQNPEMIRAHRPDGILLVKADGFFPFKVDDPMSEKIPLKTGQRIAIEVELNRKKFARIGEGILPSLLRNYEHAWYFCGNQDVYNTVVAARRDYLQTNEERKRIRILLLEEKLDEEDDE